MDCWSMVRITKIPGDYDIFRQNPESLSVIYMTTVMEADCCIDSTNGRYQNKGK